MRKQLALVMLGAAVACSPAKGDASKDTLATVDTLEPATDTLPARDSVTGMAPTKTSTPGTTSTKTAPAATKAKNDSIIGFDKVTPLDPNKRRLDTVKKRPPN